MQIKQIYFFLKYRNEQYHSLTFTLRFINQNNCLLFTYISIIDTGVIIKSFM